MNLVDLSKQQFNIETNLRVLKLVPSIAQESDIFISKNCVISLDLTLLIMCLSDILYRVHVNDFNAGFSKNYVTVNNKQSLV